MGLKSIILLSELMSIEGTTQTFFTQHETIARIRSCLDEEKGNYVTDYGKDCGMLISM